MQASEAIIKQKNQEIQNLQKELNISRKNEQLMKEFADAQIRQAHQLVKNQEDLIDRIKKENQTLKNTVNDLKGLLSQYLSGQQHNNQYNNKFIPSDYVSIQRENI